MSAAAVGMNSLPHRGSAPAFVPAFTLGLHDMKFCVCIKQVPDVSAPITIRDGALVFDTGRMVLDAYAASAVEAALVLAEAHGGTVDVVLAGPDRAKETVRKALAMGAETGTHLVTADDAELDAAAFARLLAGHLRDAGYDAILCGKQSQDTDAGLTGAMLAEHLGLPYATNAVGLEQEGDGTLVVTRQGDTGQEIIALETPCLVTCSNDMNDPRIPNIKGIMKAKRKTIETIDASAGGDAVTRVVAYEPMPEREPGPQLEGEPTELAQSLRDLLHNEAKVL